MTTRFITKTLAVSPQLNPLQIATAAAFALVINNRPDDEEPGQPSSAQMAAAAHAAGLDYLHVPVQGAPTQAQVDQMRAALERAEGPILMFCRSGMRSIFSWALVQMQSGARTRDEVVALAAEAGYDLSRALPD